MVSKCGRKLNYFGVVELDCQAALVILLKKEEDLKKAESIMLLEDEEFNQAKVELERQEEVVAAWSTQEKIVEDFKLADFSLASQARQIEDLKLTVKEKDRHVDSAKCALSLQEDDLDKMRNELTQKTEEVTMMGSELNSRIQLLNEATEVIRRQGLEAQELH
ncbi:golgin subfamily A member 6-like protein 7 [Papaver somniferum]|nr:golgin subfamily A member 6-like protein 7 [Papaver somniferum]